MREDGIVEALEKVFYGGGQGVSGGEVGNDAEDDDVPVERVGLAGAVAEIDESERVGRGGGPAVAEQHPAEARRVEEGARLPLQPAVIDLLYQAEAIHCNGEGSGGGEEEQVGYVRAGGAIEALTPEVRDEPAAEAEPPLRHGRTIAAGPRRHLSAAAGSIEGSSRSLCCRREETGEKEQGRTCCRIRVHWDFFFFLNWSIGHLLG